MGAHELVNDAHTALSESRRLLKAVDDLIHCPETGEDQ
jgi:hypothetical protein